MKNRGKEKEIKTILHLCADLGSDSKYYQLEQLEISNLSYEQVPITTPPEDTIIYLDPPYKDTEKYQYDINYENLLAWVKNSLYKIYLSSYEFDGLYECHSMKHRCTLSATANNPVTEKLFCNREPNHAEQDSLFDYL